MKENLKGKLIVTCGGMFSGKTKKLLEQIVELIKDKKQIIVLKPKIDTRDSADEIVSRVGGRYKAKVCELNNIIYPDVLNADCVLIDEMQFFETNVEKQIDYLVKCGKEVYASGLDMDYLGEPFEIMSILMAKADEIDKLHAVCKICGEDAVYSKKINDSKERIEVGSEETYMPVCRRCF